MANFQLDDDYVGAIKTLIQKKKDKKLKKQVHELHYADIAELIEELAVEEAIYLVKLLDSEKTADALAEVDEDFREKILGQLSAKEIAEEVEELDTDDAADIIAELPEERQEKVLSVRSLHSLRREGGRKRIRPRCKCASSSLLPLT